MKSINRRFRILSPAVVAAILTVPFSASILAQAPPRLEEQQREDLRRQQEQLRQDTQRDVIKTTDRDAVGSVRELAPHLTDFDKASKLIGMNIRGSDNDTLGEIEELAVDLETGRIVLAIVKAGGIGGLGSKHVAVPPGALTHDPDSNTLRMDATEASIKDGRTVDLTQWDTSFDAATVGSIYQTYGKRFGNDSGDRWSRAATPRTTPSDLQKDPNVQVNTPAALPRADADRRLARDREQQPGSDQQLVRAPADSGVLGPVERASKLIGAKVEYADGKNVGKIEELIVDLGSARLVNVVLSTGGILGVGDELSLVPPMAFHWDPGTEAVRLDATAEQLGQAHRVSGKEWPRQDRNTVNEGYRLFNFNRDNEGADVNGVPAPDNTGLNRRDRDDRTVTPFDQGNNEGDLAITTRIRKEVVGRDDFSVLAKNVKIVTVGNRVTLRGPVSSEAEKEAIAKIAGEVAGPDRVDNQLEVK
jgi:sporulation protein YlmC with PRC-barrel domain